MWDCEGRRELHHSQDILSARHETADMQLLDLPMITTPKSGRSHLGWTGPSIAQRDRRYEGRESGDRKASELYLERLAHSPFSFDSI